jgi:hypothetical protein
MAKSKTIFLPKIGVQFNKNRRENVLKRKKVGLLSKFESTTTS